MARDAPNLVLIMTDHQRHDSIGMVQAGREVCPNLNRLAERGYYFRRAYCAAPLCAPARTAMFTGKYPTLNGVVYNDFEGKTAQDHRVFQEYLSEAGYEVAHVGIDHVKVRPPYRQRVPFVLWVGNEEHDRYLAANVTDAPYPEPQLFTREIELTQFGKLVRRRFSSTRTAVWPFAAEHFLDSYWCRCAAEFLRRPHGRPFALFLFLWAPHPPLRVPEPYASAFDPDALDLPANVGLTPGDEPAGRRSGIAGQLGAGVTMEEWRKVWAAHLGLVNLADTGIGQVLASLHDAGLEDNTIVTFTVDHGDMLGQRRMYQKFEMYEPAVCTPWIVRLPGRAEPQRSDAPVSHLDVMPTLHELMGLPPSEDASGISLASCVREAAQPPERPVFCEFCGSVGRDMDRRAVISRRYKYVYDPKPDSELYDLQEDPLELHNLASDPHHGDTLGLMHDEARSWAQAHNDWLAF